MAISSLPAAVTTPSFQNDTSNHHFSDGEWITLDIYHLRRSSVFFLLEYRQLVYIWICPFYMQYTWQNDHLWAYRMPSPPPWCSTQHCYSSRNSSHSPKSETTVQCSWKSHVFAMLSTIQKQLTWKEGRSAF